MSIKMNRKKVIDYAFKGGIGLIFLCIVYFSLFASEEEDKVKNTGLNTELPDGKAEPLKGKMVAYDNSLQEENQEKRMKTLNDYVFSLKKENGINESTQEDKQYDVEIKNVPPDFKNQGVEAIRQSLQVQNQQDWEYDQLAMQKEDMETEVTRLKEELKHKNSQDNQVAMMEKSYELASKYMGKGSGIDQEAGTAPQSKEKEIRETVDVAKKGNEVVSTLSDDLQLDAPYNYGFITAVGTGYQTGTNTIRAVVSEDVAA